MASFSSSGISRVSTSTVVVLLLVRSGVARPMEGSGVGQMKLKVGTSTCTQLAVGGVSGGVISPILGLWLQDVRTIVGPS